MQSGYYEIKYSLSHIDTIDSLRALPVDKISSVLDLESVMYETVNDIGSYIWKTLITVLVTDCKIQWPYHVVTPVLNNKNQVKI